VVGLEDLEAECPGIESALVAAGFAPFLSELQSSELTVYALSDLVQLYGYYHREPSANARTLEVDGVGRIVRSLEQVQQRRTESLLQRLERWLRNVLERPQSEAPPWLSRWLQGKSLPQKVTELIVYALIALVIVLAAVVLFNELRAAGMLKRSARKRLTMLAHGAGGVVTPLTFADLEAAAWRDKPSLVLQLLVSALIASGRLQSERSLTHRELTERAALDGPEQREHFRNIAVIVERARYGREPLTSEQIQRLVMDGRALHEEITAAAGGAR
jgi:hypothetical protein